MRRESRQNKHEIMQKYDKTPYERPPVIIFMQKTQNFVKNFIENSFTLVYYLTDPNRPGIKRHMTTKQCSKCKETLELTAFYKNHRGADGLSYKCKACKKKYDKEYKKEYRVANRERIIAYAKEYYDANKAHLRAQKKEYTVANPDKVNALNAKRRAQKIQATPKWLTKRDLALMESYYIKAKLLELETGIKYHVDHTIPLNHPQVCGLHVPTNLQVITAEENLVKGNTFVVE